MRRTRVWRWSAALVVVALAATPQGLPAEPRSTAEWLLDVARDHGLQQGGGPTPADVDQVRVLLESAVRLDPGQERAWAWLHELAVLRGDMEAAARALEGLLAADPGNQAAWSAWLDVGAWGRQTVEQRSAWLEEQLASAGDPVRQSLVLVRLAELAAARLDVETARKRLERALALDPGRLEAARMALELLPPDAPPADRLRLALRYLTLCPYDLETAWGVGVLLDEVGAPDEAGLFFDYAEQIHERMRPTAPWPGRFLLELARHEVALGRWSEASGHVEQAIRTDPQVAAEAGLLYFWLLEKQGMQALAGQVRRELEARFARLREPASWPVNELAQAAWFYCTVQRQPQRALMLAQAAAERAGEDLFVRRVLGWALLDNLQVEQGTAVLLPLAGRDPYAAYRLAALAKEQGDLDAARRIVQDLACRPRAGPAFDLLASLGLGEPTSSSTIPERVAAALRVFDRRVLDFHRNPGRYVQATVRVAQRSYYPGEPWEAVFSLENRGPFRVTLGPEGMVNPVFLVSLELEGGVTRRYPGLFTVALDRLGSLAPGESVQVEATLDVGPPGRFSRRTPQHALRVTLRAVLDPVRGPDGRWQPGLGGQELPPVYFSRLPAPVGREAMHALFAALSGPSPRRRLAAVEQMAELLGESQRAALGRLSYTPEPVPARRLRQGLLAALSCDSWELRARTLGVLQLVGLDAEMLAAARACLRHEHWLVRLLAVRLLGERMGVGSAEDLRPLAEGDADELVRALAGSYLSAWEAAATHPATAPAAP